jgi:branched-subunit amino acid transport protein
MLELILSGLGTFFERAFFLISKRLRPHRAVLRYLPLVGPAVLGAIAVPGIIAPRGEISLVETLPAVIAAVVAVVLWKRTKQLIIALLGALVLWWAIVFALVQLGLR